MAVLARAQQDAVWNRQQVCNKLRSLLREYFPAFLEAFRDKPGGLARPDARRILAVAPTSALAAKLPLWPWPPVRAWTGLRTTASSRATAPRC